MAIKKRQPGKDLELTERMTTTTTTTTIQTPPREEVSAPAPSTHRQQLSRRQWLLSCPRRRPLVFVREHTHLKRDPAWITCPNCLQGVETIVERRCSGTTHMSALLLLPACFCALPYCSKMLRDTVHRCPSCGIALGAHFASAREAFVTCCYLAQHDRLEGRSAPTSGMAQFF